MKNEGKRIWISLPMSGYSDDFIDARLRKAKEKYSPLGKVITPRDAVPDRSTPYNMALGKCVEMIMTCQMAVFLNGWEYSHGCRIEDFTCSTFNISKIQDNKF